MGWLKKYWLMVLLFIVVGLLIFLKLKYSCKNQDCSGDETRTISVSKTNLGDYLPYKGKHFKAEKYINQEYLEIIIDDEINLNMAKEEVETWLKEKEVDFPKDQLIYVIGSD